MELHWRRASGVLAFLLLAISSGNDGRAQSEPTAADPQYLTFQIFTASPGFTTEEGGNVISRLPDPEFLDGEAKQILDAIGERGDERHKLGVFVGPLAMDHTDAQLRALVQRTFAIASKYKIAVGLHIDDSKFWRNRTDLWRNPANVEWLDWKGAPNGGQYLNWGMPWKLAPQACFNSRDMVEEARRIAGTVIGPAIATELAKLRQTGDENLFAGVIVGWETAIGQDFDTRRDLGFCALTNLGFTASAPPPDRDRALESVVQSWIETWSSRLAEAGVPSNRIYSHIAFSSKRQFDDAHASGGDSYSRSVLHTPPAVAFGQTHLPGFSTYPEPDKFEEIYATLQGHGNPNWASCEGANVDIQTGAPEIPEGGMETYLARMFNHGATLTNVFGWDVGDPDNPFRRAAESSQSIAAYRIFLRGDRLDEKPLDPSNGHRSILQKLMRALPAKVESYVRAGGDLGAIQARITELQANSRQGRLDAMKRDLDQIEATLDAGLEPPSRPAAAAGFDVALLQEKMRSLPGRIAVFQRRSGDIERIRDRVASVQKHVAAGELRSAFDELQALDPILDAP